jgi:hypothetical protein
MIFRGGDKLYLTFHSPNASEQEHPVFVELEERDGSIAVKR